MLQLEFLIINYLENHQLNFAIKLNGRKIKKDTKNWDIIFAIAWKNNLNIYIYMHIHIHKGKETSTLVLDFPLDFNEGLLLRLCFSALHVGMDRSILFEENIWRKGLIFFQYWLVYCWFVYFVRKTAQWNEILFSLVREYDYDKLQQTRQSCQ